MSAPLRLGTRGSPLALVQARAVAEDLRARSPGLVVELEVIRTSGDKLTDVPLAQVGGKGLFVREIEDALLAGRIDLAVHSLKDLPVILPPGLTLGAFPPREDPRDRLLSAGGGGLTDLRSGARVGTSSLRRRVQLLHRRPDLEIVPLRGNVDTRLRKLAAGEVDAVVVAAAGLRRLGRVPEGVALEADEMLPAVGQGVLGIEVRAGGGAVSDLVAGLDDPVTRRAVRTERAFLGGLGGGCQVPIAGFAIPAGEDVWLRGLVASPDGCHMVAGERRGPVDAAEVIGRELAEELLRGGAAEILGALGIVPTPGGG